jgi:hypothetical protein
MLEPFCRTLRDSLSAMTNAVLGNTYGLPCTPLVRGGAPRTGAVALLLGSGLEGGWPSAVTDSTMSALSHSVS